MAYINGKEILFSPTVNNTTAETAINGVIEQCKVALGNRITAGDFVECVEGHSITDLTPHERSIYSYSMSSCKLDEHHALICYSCSDAYETVYGRVITIEGADISVGKEYNLGTFTRLNTTADLHMRLCRLSDNKALLAWYSNMSTSSNSYYKASSVKVLSVTDTAISTGSNKILSTYMGVCSVCCLSETKALVGCQNGDGNSATIFPIEITGTTVSVGASYSVAYGYRYRRISVIPLSEEKALLIYGYIINSDDYFYGTIAKVLTLNGDLSVSGGTPIYLHTALGYTNDLWVDSIIPFSNNRIFIQPEDNEQTGFCFLNVSGTAISIENVEIEDEELKTVLGSVGVRDHINENNTLFTRSDGIVYILQKTDNGFAIIGSYDDNCNSYNSFGTDIELYDKTAFVPYKDKTTANIKGMMIMTDGSIFDTSTQARLPTATSTNRIGVAKTSGVSGEIIDVYCPINYITFLYGGNTLYAKEGTTWHEWIETEYNTYNFTEETITVGGTIYNAIVLNLGDGFYYLLADNEGNLVNPTDVIVEHHNYTSAKAISDDAPSAVGTWTFKEPIELGDFLGATLNFSSGGIQFTSIRRSMGGYTETSDLANGWGDGYSGTWISFINDSIEICVYRCGTGEWLEEYRTVTIPEEVNAFDLRRLIVTQAEKIS